MTASGSGRVYGGVTGEQRVAERRRKLIDAGMTLFGSGSSGAVRVKDVVDEARLTERYFYESFSGLDALFEAVLELCMDAIETEVNAAIVEAPDDGFARVSAALRTSVAALASDTRMIRIIFAEALSKGGRAGRRRNEILVRAAHNFFAWSNAEENDFDRSTVDSRMKLLAFAGAASELLISWAEGLLDITPSELADFLIGQYPRTHLS